MQCRTPPFEPPTRSCPSAISPSALGLAVTAIRFYENEGPLSPARNAGGQRRYLRSDIRRLSFIQIAQQLGFSIEDIRAGQPARWLYQRRRTAIRN